MQNPTARKGSSNHNQRWTISEEQPHTQTQECKSWDKTFEHVGECKDSDQQIKQFSESKDTNNWKCPCKR